MAFIIYYLNYLLIILLLAITQSEQLTAWLNAQLIPANTSYIKHVPELVLEANRHEVTMAKGIKTDGKTGRRREVCKWYSLG
jgi:hypothetical protein